MKDCINLLTPSISHDNYGIECWFENSPENVLKFHDMCMEAFPSSVFGTFWQGGSGYCPESHSKEWRYFEFLKGKGLQDEILRASMDIAAEFGMQLVIQ